MNQFNEKSDQDLSDVLRAKLKSYPDFPKPGINFLDVFSLYADLEGSQILNEVFIRKGRSMIGQIDVVVGLDARGFLMGPIIAREANVPFVPVRKSGKLPGLTVGTSYSLEYGEASVEIQKDAIPEKARVLIVDDLLATGGTLNAAATLISKLGLGITVTECFVLMELAFLKGRDKITSTVSCHATFTYLAGKEYARLLGMGSQQFKMKELNIKFSFQCMQYVIKYLSKALKKN